MTIVDGMRRRESDSACWHSAQWNPISIPSNFHSESVYRPTARSSGNVCWRAGFPGSEQDVRQTCSQCLSRGQRLNGCYLQLSGQLTPNYVPSLPGHWVRSPLEGAVGVETPNVSRAGI